MRKLFFPLLFIVAASLLLQAQPEKHEKGHHKPFEKIRELEKIKLIEILDMDEATTLKFFARRNEHLNKIDQIIQMQDEKLQQIENKIDDSDDNDPELINLVNDYISAEDQINAEKRAFVNNVREILSNKQVAKLVVFERRFKEEVRGIIFKRKR